MNDERKCIFCEKDRLSGYKCCEVHIGAYLKNKQDEKERQAEYYSDYDNMCGDGREFGY